MQRLIPRDMQFLWSAKPRAGAEGKKIFTLYPVKATPELTGGVITNARANIDPNFNQPIVTMEMNSEGSRDWARITGANINKRIAIVMDNAVFSAPVVREQDHRRQLADRGDGEHRRGPPAGDRPEGRRTPRSGGDRGTAVRRAVPRRGFHPERPPLRRPGHAADHHLHGGLLPDRRRRRGPRAGLLHALPAGVLAAFQGTLTLPGIAGIILTLAVAVDANVLIYERIREELATGKTLRAAIDAGYEKAWTAIFDSNLTTFITGVILYQFGSGPVQGFALTLMIGIVASMFSAIFITRVIFKIMTDRYAAHVNFG